jgi:hypothetical protein
MKEKTRIELLHDLCKTVGIDRKKQSQYLSKRELVHLTAWVGVKKDA